MMKIFKFMKFLLMISVMLSALSLTVYAEENQSASLTLSVEERVEEILESVMWKYTTNTEVEQLEEMKTGNIYQFNDNDYVTRGNAAIAVLRVIGMTEDIATFNPPMPYISDFHQGCVNSAGYKDYYLLTAWKDGIIKENIYKPNDFCTIEHILRVIARCVQIDNEDYAAIAKAYNLCSDDMLERTNEFLTVGELRNILIKLYDVPGEWFYRNVYDYDEIKGTDLSNSQTYYERYQKTTNYTIYNVYINGYEIQLAEDENGNQLLALSDLMKIYDISTVWNNGSVILTDSHGEELTFLLDGFSSNWRIGCDNIIYIRKMIFDENGYRIWNDDTEWWFGQYMMINDRVYITISSYIQILNYMNLPVKVIYFYDYNNKLLW